MYAKRQKIKYWIKWVIIVLLTLSIGLVIFDICYISNSHKSFKPKSYYINVDLVTIEHTLEKWEYKALITSYIDTPHIYIEKELKDAYTCGEAYPLIRTIFIDECLSNVTYAYTLAHELIHVKYQTGNETWVSFKTFVLLYESGCKPLQEVALDFAEEQLNGEIFSNEYDCSYYIFEYLQNKGIV